MVAKVEHAELELDVQAYYDAAGNKSEAARARGLGRSTYVDRLRIAGRELGFRLGKVADGKIDPVTARELRLPKRGAVKRYILTSLQNNTLLHPGFNNILGLHDWLDGHNGVDTCELMVGTFSYQKAAYGEKAVKRDSLKGDEHDKVWYAPEAERYIVDDMVQLAPALVWNGHMNILPTNKYPLNDFQTYNGRQSNVVPHTQMAMGSVASMADEATKLNYSTGTVGQMNYIQKRLGIISEQRHSYGAVLVEVDHNGNWWVRQLHIDHNDAVYDIGPSGVTGGLYVQGGQVYVGDDNGTFVKAVNWGDVHASEMDLWVRELGWGDGGMIDQLRPEFQFMNDLFSMRSRSHWELKNFHRTYEKHVDGEETVQEEMEVTADFMGEAGRDFCETVVVVSNHDKHLEKWVNEADFRLDPVNAKYFCWLQFNLLDAMDRGDKSFSLLEFALMPTRRGRVRFLEADESFVICRDTPSGGVECGLHGHEGPNGSRGSTRNLTKLGRAVNKGHDHNAAIDGLVYSAGTCATRLPYESGPSSHSSTHIVTFENASRQLLTMWAGKFRA